MKIAGFILLAIGGFYSLGALASGYNPSGGIIWIVIGGYLVWSSNKKRQDKEDKDTKLLKTARGQLDGILKMVEDDRYCMDISQQLMAVEAILNKANKEILTAHLKGCVVAATTDAEKEEKVDELVAMLGKILK